MPEKFLNKIFNFFFIRNYVNYFVVVYKGSTAKWASVDLIIDGCLCEINLSSKFIDRIHNAATAYFNFSTILDK